MNVRTMLRLWDIDYSDEYVNTPDGLVLLANLANWSAKTIDYEFYDLKQELIMRAITNHNHYWLCDGIVYFETCVGQVSFHVFDDLDSMESGRTPKSWSGIPTQEYAKELLIEFLK